MDKSEEGYFENSIYKDGHYLYSMKIDKEIGSYSTVGTITNKRTGRNMSLTGYIHRLHEFNAIEGFTFTWFDLLSGISVNLALNSSENKNEDLYIGRFNDFYTAHTYNVTVTRNFLIN